MSVKSAQHCSGIFSERKERLKERKARRESVRLAVVEKRRIGQTVKKSKQFLEKASALIE